MVERALVLGALALVTVALAAAGRALARGRLRDLRSVPSGRLWGALGAVPDGRPALVYISTPSCAACRVQATIVDGLAGSGVPVFRVDAADRPDVARAFRAVTAPTTVVLSASGTVAAVNHGLAAGERLSAQLAAAGPPPTPSPAG